MKFKNLFFLAALGLTASATLTSCEDILGHWERPTGAAVTIYSFSLQDLSEAAITATALKVTDQAGTEIATAESDGKYTINSTAIGSAATDLWLEATTATGNYIAKAKVSELSTISESGKLKMATLGNIIGADGKFYADKTAVVDASTTGAAMIVYVGNEGETNTTYNHGLAIALTDANSGFPCNWRTTGSGTDLDKQYDKWCLSTDADANTDMAGIANTATLKGIGTAYAAATAADGYSVDGFTPATYGFSGWFLPSAGQWYKFFNGMCNLSWTAFGYSGEGGSGFSTVNGKFTTAGYTDAKFGNNTSYWSSSEYDGGSVVGVYFDSSSGVQVTRFGKDSSNSVRSFLAF